MKSLVSTLTGSLPLSLAEAKNHLRVGHNEDDAAIESLIAAGIDEFERRTGRAFSEVSCVLSLDEFPDGAIYLPRPPVTEVTEISYRDSAGVHVLDELLWYASIGASPAVVIPALDTSWPVTDGRADCVVITYRAGILDKFPPLIRNALLIWLDLEFHEHDDRTAERMRRRIESVLRIVQLQHPRLAGITVK